MQKREKKNTIKQKQAPSVSGWKLSRNDEESQTSEHQGGRLMMIDKQSATSPSHARLRRRRVSSSRSLTFGLSEEACSAPLKTPVWFLPSRPHRLNSPAFPPTPWIFILLNPLPDRKRSGEPRAANSNCRGSNMATTRRHPPNHPAAWNSSQNVHLMSQVRLENSKHLYLYFFIFF